MERRVTIGRFNLFWLGAGGFLTLFCVNEIIAYRQAVVPMWLGGPLSVAGMVVGALLGLSVMAFLGIEPSAEETAGGDSPDDEADETESDEDEASDGDAGASHDAGAAGG